MPTITLDKNALIGLLKKKIKDVELAEAIDALGPSVENMTQDEVVVEVPPNRPDLLSAQGLARALSAFLNLKPGLRKYPLKKSGHVLIIDESVSQVRPWSVCAIVKGLKFADETLREVITIQEKLHITYGRNRKKCAIGIYPLEHIKPPIKFVAKKPEEIVFAPLDMSKELSGNQILALHPTGREYAHLLEGEKKYPVFIDSKNNILSMPPVINSNTVGKVSEKTKDVFVEVSGFEFEYLNTALCMITSALADMGGQIFTMEVRAKGKKFTTPDFTPKTCKIEPAYVNSRLGTTLSEAEIRKALALTGHDYAGKVVSSPRYRADLLHPIDLIEDVAIGVGYNSIALQAPSISTIAKASPRETFADSLRDILVGFGFFEVKNVHLTSPAMQLIAGLHKEDLITLANAFSEDYTTLRASMLPGIMKTLKDNKNAEYPQNIFEIGTIFSQDASQETLVRETPVLALALSSQASSFTSAKQVLLALAEALDIPFEVTDGAHSALIAGRTGIISASGVNLGLIGEVHPATLEALGLEMPTAYLELKLDALAHARIKQPAQSSIQKAPAQKKK